MLTITDDNGAARRTINVLSRGCVVPRLIGRKLGGARRALKAGGCRWERSSTSTPGGQAPTGDHAVGPAGGTRPAGTPVALTLGSYSR